MGHPPRCRWFVALAVVGLLATSCGDDASDDGTEDRDITFEVTSYPETAESEWVATGAAVDEGLLCPQAAATGMDEFEYPDGSELTVAELEQLNNVPEPFSYVAIAEYVCADGTGLFTIRAINDVEDPTTFTLTMTWQLQGGDGYEGVTGEGQNDDLSFETEGQPIVIKGSNSGVVRRT